MLTLPPEVTALVPSLGLLPMAALVTDPTGAVLWANAHCSQLTGYAPGELLGRDASTIAPIAGFTQPRLQHILHQVISTGEPWRGEVPCRRTGSVDSLSLAVTPVLGSQGAITHALWVLSTQDRAAGQPFSTSERYSAIFSSMAEGVVFMEADGRIELCNEGAERILGLTADQMAGRTSMDPNWGAIHEDGSPFPGETHPSMVTLRTGQSLSDVVMGVRKPDGSLAWISINSRPLASGAGRPHGVVTTFTDITERKSAAEAVRDAHWRLASVIEGAGAGTWEWNVQTGEAVFNEIWATIAGYTLDELAPISSKTWEALAHPADLKHSGELLQRHFSGELPYYDCECRLRHKQGHWVWVRDRGSLSTRTPDGRPLRMFGTRVDITARKRADEALREKVEERHRTILQTAMDGFWLADLSGLLLEVNDAYCRMSGYAESELLGMHASHLDAVEAVAETEAHIRRVIVQGEDRFEARHRRKDGSTYDVEVSVQYQSADGGRLIAFLRDITERKRMEAQYQTLFREMLDGFALHEILCDPQGRPVDYRFLAVNPAFERMVGLTAEAITGRSVLEVLPSLERHWIETYGRVAATGEPASFESYAGALDKYFEVTAFRPAPNQFACIVGDITARKKTEEALRASESLYRSILSASPDGIAITNLAGRVLVASPKIMQMVGCQREDQFLGHRLAEFIVSGERESAFSNSALTLQGKGPGPVEYVGLRLDGTTFTMEANGEPVRDAQGQPTGMVVIARDITERKLLEAKLAQAQKLESIGRLAGGIAHDFNNLLTVINGYCQLLLAQQSTGEPIRGNIAEILMAGERAATLTRQLLAYSRKQVLEPRKLDLNQVVREMVPMLERLVGEDVDVRVALDARAGIVHADPHQLQQVVMNLVVNARDAMPDGGRLLIEAANVEFDEAFIQSHPDLRAGHYVLLGVSDTGVGMDKDTQRKIFEPFFTTKDVGKGTGLGLSMVQGVVAQTGGQIDVYSEPGCGTTFKIYLPALIESPANSGHQPTIAAPGGPETILVVEDRPEVRDYTATVLTGYGYRVIKALDGIEALSICEQYEQRIDLVLTDVIMPHLGGRGLAIELEKRRPGIKVLFMSGYTADAIQHNGVLDDGAAFIEKPFSPRQLAAKVRSVLGQ